MTDQESNLTSVSHQSRCKQYFPVVLFIKLYRVVLTFESMDEILSVAIQTKATE